MTNHPLQDDYTREWPSFNSEFYASHCLESFLQIFDRIVSSFFLFWAISFMKRSHAGASFRIGVPSNKFISIDATSRMQYSCRRPSSPSPWPLTAASEQPSSYLFTCSLSITAPPSMLSALWTRTFIPFETSLKASLIKIAESENQIRRQMLSM